MRILTRWSTSAAPLVALATLAGCGGSGSSSPCDGQSGMPGVCIGAHIKGSFTNLQQLVITVDQPTSKRVATPDPAAPIKLPAQVALLLPAGVTGTVNVIVDGLDGNGQVVAHADHAVTLPASGRTDAEFTLAAPSGIQFGNAPDQVGYELNPLRFTVSASDADLAAGDLVVTLSGAPTGATVHQQPDGSLELSWTPGLGDAGSYPMQVTARAQSNPTIMDSHAFTLTVRNSVDPLLNPFGTSPDQLLLLAPVGDVDGDGYADFAFCSDGTPLNTVPQYSIQVVYGDKSGMPVARPYPSGRTRSITISGPAGSKESFASPFVQCSGGDLDGDGKSDIIVADSAYVAPGAGAAGGSYFVVYGTARGDANAPVTVQMVPPGGVTVGDQPIVGDWNGDGLADVAVLQTNLPTAGAGATSTIAMWTGHFPRYTGMILGQSFAYPHMCGDVALVGFAALDGQNGPGGKKGHALVWYDDGVQASGAFTESGNCPSGSGGLRVLTAGLQVNGLINVSIPRPVQPRPFAACDVDGDGRDDLIVLDRNANGWNVALAFGTSGGPTNPLPIGEPIGTMITGNAPRIACWATHAGPSSFVLSDPGGLTGNGFLSPGAVYLYGLDAGKPPLLARTIMNYDASDQVTGFGKYLIPAGDIDGDGKPELIVGDQRGFSDVDGAWLLYGQ